MYIDHYICMYVHEKSIVMNIYSNIKINIDFMGVNPFKMFCVIIISIIIIVSCNVAKVMKCT